MKLGSACRFIASIFYGRLKRGGDVFYFVSPSEFPLLNFNFYLINVYIVFIITIQGGIPRMVRVFYMEKYRIF